MGQLRYAYAYHLVKCIINKANNGHIGVFKFIYTHKDQKTIHQNINNYILGGRFNKCVFTFIFQITVYILRGKIIFKLFQS